MGSTASFIYNSLKPQHAQKYLKGFIALNSPTSMKYFPEPTKPFIPQLKKLLVSWLNFKCFLVRIYRH